MRILIVNDDGIQAPGIACLAELAKELGEIWVVGPKEQCSAMSHKITMNRPLTIEKVDFPVKGVFAYSVDGTPADCVKAGIRVLMPEKPDIVFSGINNGSNVGYDILYSGTVGAAMDALTLGVPAIAFSTQLHSDLSQVRRYFNELVQSILALEPSPTEVWNINFPGCNAEEIRGILWDRIPARKEFCTDRINVLQKGDETIFQYINVEDCEGQPDGTDMAAIRENFISVGKICCEVLQPLSKQ